MPAATAPRPSLLLVDDDPLIRSSLAYILATDFDLCIAESRSDARRQILAAGKPPALALLDLGLPPHPHRADEGLALIGELLASDPLCKIIVLSGQDEEAHARHARALGALEFIAKPASPDQLRQALQRALQLRRQEEAERQQPLALQRIRGTHPALQIVRAELQRSATTPFPVLIEGESGTGKEIAARALHELARHHDKPFVALNCAAISPGLIEATLFGHARGAFTGAVGAQAGCFEEAREGTLFLDEIGELPLDLQPKLLRVLESGEYQRLGETQRRHTGARIIAATNRDLRGEVRAGRFRADLYHRLSVLRLVMPPLRSLGEDRLALFEHYVHDYAHQLQVPPCSLTPSARTAWLGYDFPGNVRELRNIVARLLSRHAGLAISAAQLEAEFESDPDSQPASPSPAVMAAPAEQAALLARLQACGSVSLDEELRRVESDWIAAALQLAHGNMSQAARLLGLNRSTLYSRIDTLARYASQAPANESSSQG
ncbi:sigma-54-dependent transcriptional regulator [Uliginosibacterium aquaticum]|uniref:Sigma-54-dependent Fis family transcriptional regulator n=1 Tax=Uliginosibacterium aquaticum TaxID=2731212 RepID=A0ABX2ICV1_9RHOO|nr:sigma-54 dependent transcriptional regulator [Uliginosibacterium aquaticum]NSL54376.1 sigma-54-dependent Fis family transcriptional regulator [Uliginosibacterium aquaticum]